MDIGGQDNGEVEDEGEGEEHDLRVIHSQT